MDGVTAAAPQPIAPEYDSFTEVVWDHGVATHAAVWQRRLSDGVTAGRFNEPEAQCLRDRAELAGAVLSAFATQLKRGYVVIDLELIPTVQRRALAAHYRRLAQYGRLGAGDAQSRTRLVRYNEAFARSAQAALCPFVSRLSGQRLMPTFTYTAHYPTNGNLPFHHDRQQCEVTLALCLDRNEAAAGRSILCVVDGSVTACAELRPGWGLIFRGRQLPHGRVTIGSGSDAPTVMLLHYVDETFTGEIM